jgi:hypothetical protein
VKGRLARRGRWCPAAPCTMFGRTECRLRLRCRAGDPHHCCFYFCTRWHSYCPSEQGPICRRIPPAPGTHRAVKDRSFRSACTRRRLPCLARGYVHWRTAGARQAVNLINSAWAVFRGCSSVATKARDLARPARRWNTTQCWPRYASRRLDSAHPAQEHRRSFSELSNQPRKIRRDPCWPDVYPVAPYHA